jgi:hypothetical protein
MTSRDYRSFLPMTVCGSVKKGQHLMNDEFRTSEISKLKTTLRGTFRFWYGFLHCGSRTQGTDRHQVQSMNSLGVFLARASEAIVKISVRGTFGSGRPPFPRPMVNLTEPTIEEKVLTGCSRSDMEVSRWR